MIQSYHQQAENMFLHEESCMPEHQNTELRENFKSHENSMVYIKH
jgi:hypothetical protein